MKTEQSLKLQLTKRWNHLREKKAALEAEITLVEQLLINAEKNPLNPCAKMRKNSRQKWSLQAHLKHSLREAGRPVKAKQLFELVSKFEPGLKSATFRSYLKRMADSGVIVREGARGHYRLAEVQAFPTRELEQTPRRKIKAAYDYYR